MRGITLHRAGAIAAGGPPPAPPYNPLTAVAWAHAYYTEGPEFSALGLANGANVLTWPDEIAADDLTTTDATTCPTYTSAHAGIANKPGVGFSSDLNDFLRVDFADIGQPFEIVFVCDVRAIPGTRVLVASGTATGSSPGNLAEVEVVQASMKWGVAQGGGTLTGGVASIGPHLFNWYGHGGQADLVVDGAAALTNAGVGANGGVTLSLNNRWLLSNGGAQPMFGFVAIKAAQLTVQERSDLLAWARSHYGTP